MQTRKDSQANTPSAEASKPALPSRPDYKSSNDSSGTPEANSVRQSSKSSPVILSGSNTPVALPAEDVEASKAMNQLSQTLRYSSVSRKDMIEKLKSFGSLRLPTTEAINNVTAALPVSPRQVDSPDNSNLAAEKIKQVLQSLKTDEATAAPLVPPQAPESQATPVAEVVEPAAPAVVMVPEVAVVARPATPIVQVAIPEAAATPAPVLPTPVPTPVPMVAAPKAPVSKATIKEPINRNTKGKESISMRIKLGHAKAEELRARIQMEEQMEAMEKGQAAGPAAAPTPAATIENPPKPQVLARLALFKPNTTDRSTVQDITIDNLGYGITNLMNGRAKLQRQAMNRNTLSGNLAILLVGVIAAVLAVRLFLNEKDNVSEADPNLRNTIFNFVILGACVLLGTLPLLVSSSANSKMREATVVEAEIEMLEAVSKKLR